MWKGVKTDSCWLIQIWLPPIRRSVLCKVSAWQQSVDEVTWTGFLWYTCCSLSLVSVAKLSFFSVSYYTERVFVICSRCLLYCHISLHHQQYSWPKSVCCTLLFCSFKYEHIPKKVGKNDIQMTYCLKFTHKAWIAFSRLGLLVAIIFWSCPIPLSPYHI